MQESSKVADTRAVKAIETSILSVGDNLPEVADTRAVKAIETVLHTGDTTNILNVADTRAVKAIETHYLLF